MMHKVNKGFSLVEVLIALAIFTVMLAPLVTALITGMKSTNTGKEVQNRNEYAQNLMESVKEVSIDVLDDADTAYFENMGAEGISITHTTDNTTYSKTNADGSTTQLPFEKYVISGKTYLGVDRTMYSFAIQMSSAPYAEAEQLGSLNPNNLTSGVVEDLDKNEVALISAALANYDDPAYDALLTKKLSELRKRQEKHGITYDPVNDVKIFDGDTGNRIINIAVSGNASSGYDVECTLYYSDNCLETAVSGNSIGREIGMVEYVPYTQHFDKLPNIYLMYNVCVYNGKYANEYITYDLSGLDENTEVNVFVVETAAKYSTDVKTADSRSTEESWLKDDSNGLYRKAGGNDRDDVQIGMAVSANGLTDAKKNNFHVYHNMSKPSRDDYETEDEYNAAVTEWNSTNKKNINVKYNNDVATEIQNLFNSASHVYNALPNVGNLNQAQSGNRGLYEVKVWMREGNQDAGTLMSKDPVLQGTRGGGEID